ncbi:MAG: MOSC domain-containing protein [Verrucomicrobiota bacterium]|nr:MOSC domain-containing protein [Verrucomicrobiota bacterium]
MTAIGTIESVWRYPVKSMRGEELTEASMGFGGIAGDRLFAFRSAANRETFPYFTGRDQPEMLRYRPVLREDAPAAQTTVDVEAPGGTTHAIDDPALLEMLRRGADEKHQLTLMRSDRALADAYPVSLFSVQTAAKLGRETGNVWDKRRFRANLFLDLPSFAGFVENELVGRSVRIGADVVVAIAAKDGRCVMITLDPDTAAKSPSLLKQVAQAHEGTAGVYGNVVVEGIVRKGDTVELLD